MVTNNKVLTVSYGTFSCTLEGFEDSFDTMKAIAEYFRDLAADDRYFGAEPPTPDAEMLARIAEKEIARRVSARLDQGAIVLSAAAPQAESEPQAETAPQSETTQQTETATESPASEDVDAGSETDTSNVATQAKAAAAESNSRADAIAEVSSEDAPSEDTAKMSLSADNAAPIDQDDQSDTDLRADASDEADLGVDAAIDAADSDAPVADAPLSENPVTDNPVDVSVDVAADVSASEDVAQDYDNLGIPESVLAAVSGDILTVEDEGLSDPETTAAEDDIFAEVEDAETIEESASDVVIDHSAISAAVAAVEAVSDDQLQHDSDADTSADLLLLDDTFVASPQNDESDALEAEPELAAESEAVAPSEDDWDVEDIAAPEYEENSIAAKLERIRAVVARVETKDDSAPAAEIEDDQPELRTSETAFAADPADDAPEAPEANEPASDSVTEEAEAPEAAPTAKPTVRPLRARIVRMKKADFEQAVASGTLEAEDEAAEETATDAQDVASDAAAETPVDVSDSQAQPSQVSSLSAEDEADLLAELAAVQAEIASSNDAQNAEAPSEPAAVATPEDSASEDGDNVFSEIMDAPITTASEEEAEDTVPLASTDAALAGDNDTGDATSQKPLAEPADRPAAKSAKSTPEPDLSRLMAKADSEMAEPASKGRRSAIAHLRAAVAATRAERKDGKQVTTDSTSAYRDDLASVVRSASSGKAAKSDGKPAPAPLKLVAAQRVDIAPKDPSETREGQTSAHPTASSPASTSLRAPVRPRRVSSDQLDRDEVAQAAALDQTSQSTVSGFRAYAVNAEATQLPETVEAAAAFLTYVEGLDQFSRPMLMRLAREVNPHEFTREKGLRSFSQLLRDQKIGKVAGGRFTATSTIRFKPETPDADLASNHG